MKSSTGQGGVSIEKPAQFVRFEEAMRRIVKVPKEEIKKREAAAKGSTKDGNK